MAYSTCFQRRPVSHHHDWIRWRLFRVSFAMNIPPSTQVTFS
jgi:hypothetical protein